MIPTPEPLDPDPGYELVEEPPVVARRARPARLTRWVRGGLLGMAAGFAAVLAVAAGLNPYTPGGGARVMATHTQLGLPPCNMVTLIGKPCPACGMTTSFALTVRADLANAVRANWVGMLLCMTVALLVPWAVVSAVRGRYLFIRSFEAASTAGVVVLLVLMFGRWAVVLVQD